MKIKHLNYLIAVILFISTVSFSYYINYLFNIYKTNNNLNIKIISLERKIMKYIELHNKIVLTNIKDFHEENNEIEKSINNILHNTLLYKSDLITIKKLIIQTHDILHEITYSNKKDYFSKKFIFKQKKKIINNINRINNLIHKISEENNQSLNKTINNIESKIYILLITFGLLIIILFTFIKINVLDAIEKLKNHIQNFNDKNKLDEIKVLPNNEIGTFIKAFNNIIEKKINAEMKYEKIFKHSNFGICTISSNGLFLSSNTYIDSIFKKDIEGTRLINLFNKKLPFKIKKVILKIKKYNYNHIKFTYKINYKNDYKSLKCSVTTIFNNNKIDLYILILEDITKFTLLKRKEKEQELLLMQQSKLAAMGEMLGSISHQWRQPLNSLGLIFQDIFSAYKHNELSIEYFEKQKKDIMNQLNYMSNTIDEFKKFIKPSNTESIEFNIDNTLITLENLFSKQLEQYGIHLSIKKNTKEDVLLVGNEAYLKQVLMNLISNSKDAITSSTQKINKEIIINLIIEDDLLTIEIIDYADNIESTVLSRLYEPYFTTKTEGTGLGLYISKMILEQSFKTKLKIKNIIEHNNRGKKFYFTIKKI